jgi:hypothetical protein
MSQMIVPSLKDKQVLEEKNKELGNSSLNNEEEVIQIPEIYDASVAKDKNDTSNLNVLIVS